MKKIVIIALMALSIGAVSAQDSISTQKYYQYIQIVGTSKLFSTNVKIEIDYGQKTTFWNSAKEKAVTDSSGKPIIFNSMVDAMNYFGAQGWEFVQAYVVTIGQQNVYHWLLKREISSAEANSIITKSDVLNKYRID